MEDYKINTLVISQLTYDFGYMSEKGKRLPEMNNTTTTPPLPHHYPTTKKGGTDKNDMFFGLENYKIGILEEYKILRLEKGVEEDGDSLNLSN